MRVRAHAFVCALACLLVLLATGPSVQAQKETPEAYAKRVGGDAQVVPPGQLRIDGRAVTCGQRPTVLDPALKDVSAAYPGFMVLNPRRLETVPLQVKLWIHAQSCGYQFGGPDGAKADCFAVERGRQQGWLDGTGLDQICGFISPTAGSAEHRPGPERCTAMRACFAAAAAKTQAAPATPKANQ